MLTAAKLAWVITVLLIVSFPFLSHGQCTAGNITKAHASATYTPFLDPDSDGYITESGAVFPTDSTEKAEFEVLANSLTGWQAIVDVSEVHSDITPNCGNADLITDANGGDFAFYNIIDPTPASPTSGDEYIVLRFRLAKSPNGSFGYNFLFDTDLQYGAGIDPNGVCGNQGFEREVQFANAGGNKGVSVYDVDGGTTLSPTTPACTQCISYNDVQEACAGSAGGCATPDPQLLTFALPMAYIGIGSDVDTSLFYVALGTANSGNGTSVLGGGNANDIGGIDGSSGGCPDCAGLSGCALFDCQTDCINVEFNQAYMNNLPVTLTHFIARKADDHSVELTWSTASEWNNDYFQIDYSNDGKLFYPIGYVRGQGTSPDQRNDYSFVHENLNSSSNYYRLRQVDFDGQYAFSPVAFVELEPDDQWATVSPTVVQERVQFEFHTPKMAHLSLRLMDMNGKTHILKSMEATAGSNIFWLNMGHLPAGMYTLIAVDRSTRRPVGQGTWKIIK